MQKARCRGSSKKHPIITLWGAKTPPKIDPGGRGEPPDRLPRATSAKKTFIFGSCPLFGGYCVAWTGDVVRSGYGTQRNSAEPRQDSSLGTPDNYRQWNP